MKKSFLVITLSTLMIIHAQASETQECGIPEEAMESTCQEVPSIKDAPDHMVIPVTSISSQEGGETPHYAPELIPEFLAAKDWRAALLFP